jgi:DNA repair protein RadC
MTYVIRDMPADDRPRERMLSHGAHTLSDSELLAVIIGCGVRGKNAIELAHDLLVDGVQNLRSRDITALATTNGIGPAKTARIGAAVELARRLARVKEPERPLYDSCVLGEELVRAHGHETQERFCVALLDARHRIIKHQEIFVGTLDKTLVSTRDIIRVAVVHRAKAVVIYHNHPSGDPTPSDEDIAFTRKLRESLEIVDVDLIDHLVIGTHRFASMKARGEL